MKSNLPAIDLLEATHRFPGPYMFKAIGRSENGFAARAVAAVRDALAEATDPPFRVREAVGGRHVAVTVTADVQTAVQVLAVYRRLRALVGLVVLW
jgi:putative lipoic acid-binding regulatory protein